VRARWTHGLALSGALALAGAAVLIAPRIGGGEEAPAALRLKHVTRASQLGARPLGLAFIAASGRFIVLGDDAPVAPAIDPAQRAPAATGTAAPRASRSVQVTALRETLATAAFAADGIDPRAAAFDDVDGRLLALDVASRTVTAVPFDAQGRLDPANARRLAGPALGLVRPAGAAVDPVSGTMFVLDRLSRRIARFAPGDPERATWITPEPPLAGEPRALAFDAARRHLFAIDLAGPALHELTLEGREVARWALTGMGVDDPRAMVIAPSGDLTDDPATPSVFVADGGPTGAGMPRMVELAWATPMARLPESAAAALAVSLVRRTATSAWSPPSPDPDGIAYNPSSGRLIISDSEVDETPLFASRNVWETSLSGSVRRSFNVSSFTIEPTGVAFDRNNRHLFISDDDRRRVFDVDPGADGTYGTSDDSHTSFSTTTFGATDPEGIAYDRFDHRLFICDGTNQEIYVIQLGSNDHFDSGDAVSHFDVARFGVDDPETVEFREDTRTLLTIGHTDRRLTELTIGGSLVSQTSLSFTTLPHPAGLAYAPTSNDASSNSVYIVCRGVDNDQDPNENDGVLVEIKIGGTAPPPPPPGTVSIRVAASADDAEEQADGRVFLTSPDLELVWDGTLQTVGMRFRNVTIPRGATITRAYVQFEAFATNSATTNVTIRGQDSDDASAFTTSSGNVSSRPRTSASRSWSPVPWTTVGAAGTDQRTPDLSAVIKDIVARSGWASGHALAIIITGTTTGRRTAAAFDGKASGAPVLHVEFSTSSTASASEAPSD
jgi:uncharacterized protein YjiK